MTDLTPNHLREILIYQPETGRLFWDERTPDMFSDGYRSAAGNCANWNSRWAGKEAFTSFDNGYKVGAVGGKKLYAHRVAWGVFYGEWPNIIDHINRNRSDNRIYNLRSVDAFENARNATIKSSNKSGINGVSWCASSNKWRASIQLDGRAKHLGVFENKSDAENARLSAQFNIFHENHGREMV